MPSVSSSSTAPQPVTRSARLTLKVGRMPLSPDAYARVVRVQVDQALNAALRVTLHIRDEDGAFSQKRPLNLGDPISIGLDWSDGKPATPLAQGVISGLGHQFTEEGILLKVVGHGPRYALQHGRLMVGYDKVSGNDVMTRAAQAQRVSLQVRQARLRRPHLLVSGRPVARLLEEQAARSGLVLRESGLGVKAEALVLDGPAPTLTFGQSLHDIRVEVNTLQQVSKVKVYGVELATHKAIVGEATAAQALGLVGTARSGASVAEKAFGAAILEVGDAPVHSKEEARTLARALFNDRLFRFVTAWGQASGCPELTLGGVVELAGLGRRLSGRYLVTRIEHRYHASPETSGTAPQGGIPSGPGMGLGFQTHFEACRPAVGR